jgi:hypothetical protein
MTTFELLSTGEPATGTDPLRLAAAAYLARFTGLSPTPAESDLRIYFVWCAERGVDPLAASRAQVELYVRWMQEMRRFKPSTVSGLRAKSFAQVRRGLTVGGVGEARRGAGAWEAVGS